MKIYFRHRQYALPLFNIHRPGKHTLWVRGLDVYLIHKTILQPVYDRPNIYLFFKDIIRRNYAKFVIIFKHYVIIAGELPCLRFNLTHN
jgi:hypothetical protein